MPKYKVSFDGGLRFIIEAPSKPEAYNTVCAILTELTAEHITDDDIIIEEIETNGI